MASPRQPLPIPLQADETETEFRKMLNGDKYYGADPYLTRLRHAFARRVSAFNAEQDEHKRHVLMRDFLVFEGDPSGTYVGPDFYCEYGFNVIIGEDVNMGPGILIADVAQVRIGSRTLIGPRCQFYTPCHPLIPEERAGTKGPDWAEPITIGTDCWIGGGVIICPGVTVGNGVTIGAGSVVTKDIEDRSVAVGNPARVVKKV